MAFVKNNEARVHRIGAQDGVHGEITLHPGNNPVADADWKEAKKIPLVQHYLKEGTWEEVRPATAEREGVATDPTGATAPAPAVRLTDLKVNEAVEMIEGTFSRDTLNAWKGQDERRQVQSAIDKQLKFIADAGGEAEAQEAAQD